MIFSWWQRLVFECFGLESEIDGDECKQEKEWSLLCFAFPSLVYRFYLSQYGQIDKNLLS